MQRKVNTHTHTYIYKVANCSKALKQAGHPHMKKVSNSPKTDGAFPTKKKKKKEKKKKTIRSGWGSIVFLSFSDSGGSSPVAAAA